MNLAAVMLVKDEVDIIEQTILHLFTEGVDHVYVLDNGSTDGTWDILGDLLGRTDMTLGLDPEVGYFQSRKTTALAQQARADGFDWVIPCDSDEWWYSSFGSLKEIISQHDAAGYDLVRAELWDHIPTAADDPDDENPYSRIGWRFGLPGRLPKVACRCRDDLTILMGNHGAVFTAPALFRESSALSLRHFTWRSEDQYVKKIRNGWEAYSHADMPPNVGTHWRMFGPPSEPTWEERVRAHFQAWFFAPDPPIPPDRSGSELVHDPIVR